MSNYKGRGRTNYVTVEDIDGLKKALAPFPVNVCTNHFGKVSLISRSDHGWPAFEMDEEGNEAMLDVTDLVMPFVKEGEVLVLLEVGSEGFRYVSGSACAWIRRGTEVSELNLSLANIYQMASETFGAPLADITPAEH